MAKDDFFVIAYKILSYLYACMKAGEDPKTEELSSERLKIPERYYYSVITALYEDGYINGVREIHTPLPCSIPSMKQRTLRHFRQSFGGNAWRI